MTHDDTTLQAAIDAAFLTNGDNHCGNLVTHKGHYTWHREVPARLAVAKAFLAALPPAEQPAPDERSLGQVAFDAFGYTHSWDVSMRQGDWQRAAQAVVEAVRGKQDPEIEKLKAELTQTQKHLAEANRGAQRNAHVNQSLATKLNEALKRAEKAEADSVPAEAATFEVHGKTWTRHTPGDPMPCDGEAKVEWILEDELNGTRPFTNGFIPAKDLGNWNGIIGWRYADKPAPPLPWQPAVGDVVRLKSGGPDMTVKDITSDGLACCIWFHPDGQYDQTTMPAASLELVRKEKP